jgi:uncharacterized protein YndB with AHSA1/START domain
MTPPVVHSTFTVERTYPAPAARVFAAFSDPATKRRWFAEGEGWEVEEYSLDFRVGGSERARFRFGGNASVPAGPMHHDSVFLDIVRDRRIVFAYSMARDGAPFSASLSTVELTPAGDGTRLLLTEQAAFFEGADGPELRAGGWRALFEQLGRALGEGR